MTQELPKPGEVFRRSIAVDRAALATRASGDDRIPISISSEEPCDRWFGREVLEHSKSAINLAHAKDGLPFLADHDSTRQIGLVTDVALRKDGKLGGFLRKGNHPDAGWYFKDIEDGIRANISVGYRIDSLKLDEETDGVDTYRAVRWTPMECSTVSVPADITVGVGRNAETKPEPIVIPFRFEMDDTDALTKALAGIAQQREPRVSDEDDDHNPQVLCAREGCGHPYSVHEGACQRSGCACEAFEEPASGSKSTSPAPRPKERTMSEEVTGSDAAPAHKAGLRAVSLEDKQKDFADIARLGKEHGMSDEVPGWIEKGFSRDRVCAEILAKKQKEATAVEVPGYLGMSVKDGLKFNYTKAITNLMNQRWERENSYEKEVSDAVAKRLDKSTAGFFIPLDLPVLHRTAITGNVVGTSSLGGAGVQTSILSLIDLLRNKMLVRKLGATVLSGLTGNISFPRHIVANTMAWEGENPSTAHANTAATFDNVTLSPKTAMASSSYSRQLLVQSSFDVSAFIQNDLATVLALGLDLAALDGTGANNQPTGVMRQTGVTAITHTGANGGIPTWADMVSYETNVATNNADIGNIAWVATPGLRGKLKTVLRSTTAGSTYIWGDDQTINGYAAYATSQMPSNFTFGTSTTVAHGVAFGVWSELLIGEWGGAVEVVIDPYTQASQGMVAITQLLLADIAVKHPKAFSITKSALIA